MDRRKFIKLGMGGMAALVVGSGMDWVYDDPAYAAKAAGLVLNFHITDALKDMVTHNSVNSAQCYFWVFKEDRLPAECPGPIIFTTTGATMTINVTNDLDEPHAFSIPALGFTTGPIAVGAKVTKKLKARQAGTFLYYDDMNAPVNRVMGLHGALIVMPKKAARGHKMTPFDRPGPNVQKLFDDLGTAPWWPGLAWHEGDTATDTPPFRQNIWVMHQASPNLFAAVGDKTPISFTTEGGTVFSNANPRDPHVFTEAFLHDRFNPVHDPANPQNSNFIAQYFTISGVSGHFAHNSPWTCPYSRVGEPYLIRLLNAGMWLHSTHIHANHVFVLSHNHATDVFPGSLDNPIWVDVYTANPLDTYEWLIPYMRPPDVPNDLGIGRDDLEKSLDVTNSAVALAGYGIANPAGPLPFLPADIPAATAQLTWPPEQEMQMFIPNVGSRMVLAQDGVTPIDAAVRLSPICFPMHDHSEPSQVAQGGNYNCGLISGIVFTGDRKGGRPGEVAKVLTFADRPTTGDPGIPIAHGPDCEPGFSGVLPPDPQFVMPSIP